ncbi:MAG: hypothetical protein AAB795_04120 [Patescibacteria group bacterium]
MLIVGIIGPYISGFQRLKIEHNIANAQYIGIRIANYFKETRLVGFFIPHTHTARFEVLANAPEQYYHELDDSIYDSSCKAGIMLPEWNKSNGARRDCARFIQQKKRLFELKSYEEADIIVILNELERWAQQFKS